MRTALLTMITVGIASVIMTVPSYALSGGMPVLGHASDVAQESAATTVDYRYRRRWRNERYYRHRVPPVYYAPRAYYPPPVVYYPPPVIYYPPPVIYNAYPPPPLVRYRSYRQRYDSYHVDWDDSYK